MDRYRRTADRLAVRLLRAFKAMRWIPLCLAALMILGMTGNARAKNHVVRIGFPIQEGISYINERGDYAGYLVDYLHQLELFTNWDVEFVQAEGDLDTQLSTLMYMLRDGKLDMMGTMNRTDVLEEMFLYPSYSYGTTYTTLAVPEEDLRWIEDCYSNWNGIRVAYYPGYQDRMDEFAYYAGVNNFTYVPVECETYAEMAEAVQTGEADAMIQADLAMTEGFRVIGRFSPTPYYFAVSKDNTQLLQELNLAMRSLNDAQPNLQNELYELYFRNTGKFQLSEEYQDFIQSLGTLRVLFFAGGAPLQYLKDGELKGFAVEYLEDFARSTGLRYEPVVAYSYDQAVELLSSGQVDLAACVPTNSDLSSLTAVRFTLPYFNSFSVSACKNPEPHVHPSDLEFRINAERALAEIQNSDQHAIQMDYYSLSYYLRKEAVYDDVIIDWSNTKNFSYVFAVLGDLPDDLLAILNQYVSSSDDSDMLTMLYYYSGDEVEYTSQEWLMIYHPFLIGGVALAVLVACLFLLLIRNQRAAQKALQAEKQLAQLAMYDRVTGAYNETTFRERLQEASQRKENLALAAINIHGFKYINDTYGIKRANDILRYIKDILDRKMGDGEFFCRASADLFYLALEETKLDRLACRMEDVMGQICAKGTEALDGHALSLYSGAVFMAISPAPYNVPANMSYMMVALAHAKKINCHTVYLFDEELYQDEQLRYYMETHMQTALDRGEYLLYLQPKMNLRTGHVDGAEALARWQPQDRDMIYPNQFIPLFEENGFCVQLDLYMVERACETLRAWMDEGLSPITISVNQSKSLFVKEDYVDRLLAITGRYHVSPRYIILEILEGLAFENIEGWNNTIQKLNQAGFRVSMDDFGSGYSSLNTLGKLQIDELKLDRAFLMDVVKDQDSSTGQVLSAVFALARRLGIKTVAEGVETKDCEEMVRAMACDYGQGYYYNRPIPAEEFRRRFFAS